MLDEAVLKYGLRRRLRGGSLRNGNRVALRRRNAERREAHREMGIR